MAPIRNPTFHGSPIRKCVAAATAKAVNNTQPTANRMIGRKLNLNSRQLIATLAE